MTPAARGGPGGGRRTHLALRLLLFVGLGLGLAGVTTPFVPARLPWSALPGLVGAVVAGWTLLALDGRSPSALGYRLDRGAPLEALRGVLLGILVAAVTVALIVLAGALRWRADAGGLGDWLRTGALTLWLLAIPAAAEEALLRGYPLQALAEAWGRGWALLTTSLVFALLHLPNPWVGWVALLNVTTAGLFLGALYLRTGSLWWATGAHLGWNWAHAFLADLPVSGLDLADAPLVEAVQSGPAWLSGGGFGPEGSVLTTGAMLAAAAWSWRTGRLSPRRSPHASDRRSSPLIAPHGAAGEED